MTLPCPLSAAGFAERVLTFVDCQAQTLGDRGYAALASPTSSISLLLGGALTIFVALFGYRLLLGERLAVRDTVGGVVKIGIVLTLATSWVAYRTLIYDVTLRAPAELASDIGAGSGIPGLRGDLVSRVDNADALFQAMERLGPGGASDQALSDDRSRIVAADRGPQPWLGFDRFALGMSRMTFLLGAVGALAALKLIAGLALALGPLFAVFLLFRSTTGFFEGWVRSLVGLALGAAFASVIVGIHLAFLEPWLADLIAQRNAGYATPQAPAELLVFSLIFVGCVVAAVLAAMRLTRSFRLGAPPAIILPPANPAESWSRPSEWPAATFDRTAPRDDRPRALAIANALAQADRRDTAAIELAKRVSVSSQSATGPIARQTSDGAMRAPTTPFDRRTMNRGSASARRRDTRS